MTCDQFRHLSESLHPTEASHEQRLSARDHLRVCWDCSLWLADAESHKPPPTAAEKQTLDELARSDMRMEAERN